MTAIAAEGDVTALQWRVLAGELERVRAQGVHERAVIPAPAHLQRAAVPRIRQVDLEFEYGGRGSGVPDDSCHLAEIAVEVARLGCRDGHCGFDGSTAGGQADRRGRNRETFERCTVSGELGRRILCPPRYGGRYDYRADTCAESLFQHCISHGGKSEGLVVAGLGGCRAYCTASSPHPGQQVAQHLEHYL